jgi:hypothetical protein
MVKCKDSSQVQAELDVFKVTLGREMCIVFRKMFTFFRPWISNLQLLKLYYAARSRQL